MQRSEIVWIQFARATARNIVPFAASIFSPHSGREGSSAKKVCVPRAHFAYLFARAFNRRGRDGACARSPEMHSNDNAQMKPRLVRKSHAILSQDSFPYANRAVNLPVYLRFFNKEPLLYGDCSNWLINRFVAFERNEKSIGALAIFLRSIEASSAKKRGASATIFVHLFGSREKVLPLASCAR